jgi:hypothetical protein
VLFFEYQCRCNLMRFETFLIRLCRELDDLYSSKGASFSVMWDMCLDGMHMAKNILKDVMAELKKKCKLSVSDMEQMNSRMACVEFVTGTSANKPTRPSASGNWSSKIICLFVYLLRFILKHTYHRSIATTLCTCSYL